MCENQITQQVRSRISLRNASWLFIIDECLESEALGRGRSIAQPAKVKVKKQRELLCLCVRVEINFWLVELTFLLDVNRSDKSFQDSRIGLLIEC